MSQQNDQSGGSRTGGLRGLSGSVAAACAAVLAVGGLQGCENTGQGAVSGAGLGALTGLAIGSMTGNAGKGAAIGAIGGGVAGGAIGNQNQRQRANNEAIVASNNNRPQPIVVQQAPNGGIAIPGNNTAGMSQNDRERLALARFARNWSVSGWETVGGQRTLVTGSASGSVANAFFVRLDVIVRDDQSNRVNTGSIVFASEPGRGLTMNSRFDTSPSPVTYAGTVSDDGNLFTLEEVAPGFATGRRVVIRFLSNEQWVADETERVGGQNVAVGSLTFSGAR